MNIILGHFELMQWWEVNYRVDDTIQLPFMCYTENNKITIALTGKKLNL